jgi:hypothetical protein
MGRVYQPALKIWLRSTGDASSTTQRAGAALWPGLAALLLARIRFEAVHTFSMVSS